MNVLNLLDVLKLVGVSSVPVGLLIVAVLLFGKKYAEHILDSMQGRREQERAKELEEFKSVLQVAATKQHVTFSKLHEDRARVIVDMYGLLAEAEMAMKPLVSILGTASGPTKEQQALSAQEALHKLYRYVRKSDVYFDGDIRRLIGDITTEYSSAFTYMTFYPPDAPSRDGAEAAIKTGFWRDAAEIVEKRVPPLMERLRLEMQKLLGIPGEWEH